MDRTGLNLLENTVNQKVKELGLDINLLDSMHAENGKALGSWPEGCYLPLNAYHAVLQQQEKYEDNGAAFMTDSLTAAILIPFQLQKAVFSFSDQLTAAMADYDIDDRISSSLEKLPQLSCCLEVPGLSWNNKPVACLIASIVYDVRTLSNTLCTLMLTAAGLEIGFSVRLCDELTFREVLAASGKQIKSYLASRSPESLEGIDVDAKIAATEETIRTALGYIVRLTEENTCFVNSRGEVLNVLPGLNITQTRRGRKIFRASNLSCYEAALQA